MGASSAASTHRIGELARAVTGRSYRCRAEPAQFVERLNAKAHDLVIGLVTIVVPWLLVLALSQISNIAGLAATLVALLGLPAAWTLVSAMNLTPRGSFGKRVYDMMLLTHDATQISHLRRTIRWLLQAVPAYGWAVPLTVAIVRGEIDGDEPRWLIGFMFPLMCLSFFALVINFILVGTARRALHDLLTGTIVGYAIETPDRRTGFDVLPTRSEASRDG